MNKIIKYNKHYVVYFKKDLDISPVEISEQGGITLIKQLNSEDFVMINGEYHNKYNIIRVKPYEIDNEIDKLLNNETISVRNKVKEFMRLYRNKITTGVIKNMIEKAKEDLYL